MPVPLYPGAERPPGAVPPVPDLAGVTEVRLHGVGGTTPETLLCDLSPQQVAGDATAGFYRTADRRGRHVEAYSWGGLTSHSSWRVLWLLLLPFMLANLAGWMCPGWLPARPRRFHAFSWAVRVAGLGVTLNWVLLVSLLLGDYVAYQCGGTPQCPWRPSGAPWLVWLLDYPSRRVLAGAVVTLLLVAVMWVLARTTQDRYEAIKPAARVDEVPVTDGRPYDLTHPGFWDGVGYARLLTRAHIASCFAGVALLVSWTVRALVPAPVAAPLSVVSFAAGLFVLVAAVATLFTRSADGWAVMLSRALPAVAALAIGCAGVFAWLQPPGDPLAGRPHELPGLQDFVNVSLGAIFCAFFLVGVALVAGSVTREQWKGVVVRIAGVCAGFAASIAALEFAGHPSGWILVGLGIGMVIILFGVGSRKRTSTFRWAASFVVLGLALATTNTFFIGLVTLLADVMGTITECVDPYRAGSVCAGEGEGPFIAVFPMIGDAVPYLIVVPVVLIVGFCLWQLAVMLARGRSGAAGVAADYQKIADEPRSVWWVSTVPGKDGRGVPSWYARQAAGWTAKVARARRLADVPLDLDLLLTSAVGVGVVLLAWIELRVWVWDEPVDSVFRQFSAVLATALPVIAMLLLRGAWRSMDKRRIMGVLWDVGTFWPRRYHPFAPPSYAERAVPELQRRLWWLHDNDGRVLVAAHSQGSVLAAAALAQPGARPRDDRVTLVTFGCPLRKLYHWGFPAYFHEELFTRLVDPGSPSRLRMWRNFSVPTDYVGGRVFEHDRHDVERSLPDPSTCVFRYGEPPPAIGAHTGYWESAAMWEQVDDLAEKLRAD